MRKRQDIRFDILSNKLWHTMCDAGLSMPCELGASANLDLPYIYVRKYGLIYCNPCCHQIGLATLLALELGCDSFHDIEPDKLSPPLPIYGASEYAEYYMEHTEGVCFKSSVSKSALAWNRHSINQNELDYFYPVKYVQNR